MRRRESAFFEISHPKKVLIVAQPAASAFHVRLLHVHAVAELRVSRRLILHAQLEIFPLETVDTFVAELIAKRAHQLCVAGKETRLEHRCFRQHIAIGLRDGLFDRARRVTDFETNVPKEIKNLFDHFTEFARNAACFCR